LAEKTLPETSRNKVKEADLADFLLSEWVKSQKCEQAAFHLGENVGR
jgi:hypothetical protein